MSEEVSKVRETTFYPLTSKDRRFDQLNQFINLNKHRDCDFEVSADLRNEMSRCQRALNLIHTKSLTKYVAGLRRAHKPELRDRGKTPIQHYDTMIDITL